MASWCFQGLRELSRRCQQLQNAVNPAKRKIRFRQSQFGTTMNSNFTVHRSRLKSLPTSVEVGNWDADFKLGWSRHPVRRNLFKWIRQRRCRVLIIFFWFFFYWSRRSTPTLDQLNSATELPSSTVNSEATDVDFYDFSYLKITQKYVGIVYLP